jgi:hypothetical protein
LACIFILGLYFATEWRVNTLVALKRLTGRALLCSS